MVEALAGEAVLMAGLDGYADRGGVVTPYEKRNGGLPYGPDGYTQADQRSDTSFLVGADYGRQSERARLATLLGFNTEKTKKVFQEYIRTGDITLIGLEPKR